MPAIPSALADTVLVPRRAVIVFFLIHLTPWLMVAVMTGHFLRAPHRRHHPDARMAPAVLPDGFVRGKAGPWGEIEYQRLHADLPEGSMPASHCTPQPIRWVFANRTPEALTHLIATLGLPGDLHDELTDRRRWRADVDRGAIEVSPSDHLILGLPQDARTSLCRILAESPANRWHISPFTLHRSSLDQWRSGGSLTPGTVDLLERLVYGSGDLLLFSDKDLLLSRLPAGERLPVMKVLTRRSVLAARLRVRPGADVEQLAAYWCKGSRVRSAVPLLRALSNSPTGGTLDLYHLLPPFARMRLNRYPDSSRNAFQPDSFWSSANFFNDAPDERLLNVDEFVRLLDRDYFPVDADPSYGDVILLTDDSGALFTSGNYIADDIVFIKSRGSQSIPWIMTSISDLETVACHFRPTRKITYRKIHL